MPRKKVVKETEIKTPEPEKSASAPVKLRLDKKHFDYSHRAADINRRQTYVWLGVGVVLSAIVFFWLWSLKIGFSSFSWQNSKEHEMVNDMKDNWQKQFADTKPILNEEEKILVQNKLKSIISQTISSGTGTTTTSTISTTSTTIN